MKKVLSPFRYYGSKARLMKHIVRLLPPHRLYVSGFGGSGSDITCKKPSFQEIYNDLNENLVNFFRVLNDREQYGRLLSLVAGSPLSRGIHTDCQRIVRHGHKDPVMRAFAVFYSSFLCFSGMDAAARKSIAISSTAPVPARWRTADQHLWAVRKRFRAVFLENKGWQDIITKFDGPDTVFYLDPPYEHSTRTTTKEYLYEMSTDGHEELLVRLRTVTGFVVMSGYDCPLYQHYLSKWRRRDIQVICAASSLRAPRVETVWMNYDEGGRRLLS